MTADQRLDQLEPLMSENMAILDRHTAQLKQLIGIAMQHSDSISFVLREIIAIRNELTEIKAEQTVIKDGQNGISAKLDQILDKLNGSGS